MATTEVRIILLSCTHLVKTEQLSPFPFSCVGSKQRSFSACHHNKQVSNNRRGKWVTLLTSVLLYPPLPNNSTSPPLPPDSGQIISVCFSRLRARVVRYQRKFIPFTLILGVFIELPHQMFLSRRGNRGKGLQTRANGSLPQ